MLGIFPTGLCCCFIEVASFVFAGNQTAWADDQLLCLEIKGKKKDGTTINNFPYTVKNIFKCSTGKKNTISEKNSLAGMALF